MRISGIAESVPRRHIHTSANSASAIPTSEYALSPSLDAVDAVVASQSPTTCARSLTANTPSPTAKAARQIRVRVSTNTPDREHDRDRDVRPRRRRRHPQELTGRADGAPVGAELDRPAVDDVADRRIALHRRWIRGAHEVRAVVVPRRGGARRHLVPHRRRRRVRRLRRLARGDARPVEVRRR